MNMKKLSILITGITLFLMAAGVAGALPNWRSQPTVRATTEVDVDEGFSYQGRLLNPEGVPLSGTYPMQFIIYDAAVGGSAVWNSGELQVNVENGLFTVELGADQSDFDGRALWLSITVDEQTLSPRQEILPTPYALSLRPGADIRGDSIDATDAILAGYAPATGTALYAEANGGSGLFSSSQDSYGIWASSDNSWGGYFTSQDGLGMRIDTNGTDIYDYGLYVTSEWGHSVYAQSTENQAVRGEAGDITGFNRPFGPVGVVGIGSSRGVYGSSGNGSGTYGSSDANYGVWGQSETYRGITGRTDRADNDYGLHTPDNLYALNTHLRGAVMQVVQNGGSTPVEAGDVMLFSGVTAPQTAGEPPLIQVAAATEAHSTAVAGVVFSKYNEAALQADLEDPTGVNPEVNQAATLAGPAAPGDYLLLVVQGPALVKAEAGNGAIQPGDLLAAGGTTGVAALAATVTIEGVTTAVPGSFFGKALEPLTAGTDLIYVFVTLQ